MEDNSQYFLVVSACSLYFSETPDNVDEYWWLRWVSRYVISDQPEEDGVIMGGNLMRIFGAFDRQAWLEYAL